MRFPERVSRHVLLHLLALSFEIALNLKIARRPMIKNSKSSIIFNDPLYLILEFIFNF